MLRNYYTILIKFGIVVFFLMQCKFKIFTDAQNMSFNLIECLFSCPVFLKNTIISANKQRLVIISLLLCMCICGESVS